MIKKFITLTSCLILFLAFADVVQAATFTWSPSSVTVGVDQTTSVTLNLDTQDVKASGADVVLTFDPNLVEVQGVTFSSPNLFPQNFYIQDAGTINLTSSFIDVSGGFTGTNSYAQVNLKGKTAGTTNLSFSCNGTDTNDTNVVDQITASDAIDCSSLSSLSVTISAGEVVVSPSPTETPQESPAASTQASSTPSITPSIAPSSVPGCARPPAPKSLTAKAHSSTSVLLSWGSATVDHYAIEYGPAANDYRWGASNIGSGNQFLVENLSPRTTYYFALIPFSACGSSGSTLTASASTSTTSSVAVLPGKKASPSPNPVTDISSINNLVSKVYAETLPAKSEISLPGVSPSPKASSKPTTEKAGFQLSSLLLPGIIIVVLIAIIMFLLRRSKSTPNLPPDLERPTPPGIPPTPPQAPTPPQPQVTTPPQPEVTPPTPPSPPGLI